MVKECKPGQIRNPASGRCVDADGPTGRKLRGLKALPKFGPRAPLQKACPAGKVRNPRTSRCVAAMTLCHTMNGVNPAKFGNAVAAQCRNALTKKIAGVPSRLPNKTYSIDPELVYRTGNNTARRQAVRARLQAAGGGRRMAAPAGMRRLTVKEVVKRGTLQAFAGPQAQVKLSVSGNETGSFIEAWVGKYPDNNMAFQLMPDRRGNLSIGNDPVWVKAGKR